MKKILSLSVIAFCFISNIAAASSQPVDTLIISDKPAKTVITESPAGLKVVITPLDSAGSETIFFQDFSRNISVSTSQKSATKKRTSLNSGFDLSANSEWSLTSGGLCLGLVNPAGQPDYSNLQWSKSIEIAWINALAVSYRKQLMSISLGLGFDWRNYRTTFTDQRMTVTPEGGIGFIPYPEGVRSKGSRIKIFSLSVPLLYTQRIPGSSLSFTAGPIVNFNTHASLKTDFINPDGNETELWEKGFHHRRVSIDLFGSFKVFQGCGIYFRYSPQSVLKGHGSPQFKPMSVGLVFLL